MSVLGKNVLVAAMHGDIQIAGSGKPGGEIFWCKSVLNRHWHNCLKLAGHGECDGAFPRPTSFAARSGMAAGEMNG